MGDHYKAKQVNEQEEFHQMSSPFLTLVTCGWNPKFTTRREEVDCTIENRPFIEARADLAPGENVETGPELGEDESVIRIFMCGRPESDMRTDKVEAFCFGANLALLQTEKGEGNKIAVAWLDERSFEAGKSRLRTRSGPLTASRLYKELKKPVSQSLDFPLPSHGEVRWSCRLTKADWWCLQRYRLGGPNLPIVLHNDGSSGGGSCGSNAIRDTSRLDPDQNEGRCEEPDAERRLMWVYITVLRDSRILWRVRPGHSQLRRFITDLDRWSIYALIGTASNYQAFALRDALYKHLAFENFIGVIFPVSLSTLRLSDSHYLMLIGSSYSGGWLCFSCHSIYLTMHGGLRRTHAKIIVEMQMLTLSGNLWTSRSSTLRT